MSSDDLGIEEKNAIDSMTKVLMDFSSESEMQIILKNIEFLDKLSYEFLDCVDLFDDEELEYHDYYSYSDIIELVKDFLDTIDLSYSKKFDDLLNNGTINIYHIDDEDAVDIYGEDAFCVEDDIPKYDENDIIVGFDKKREINVPLQHTLDDAYSLIHEFIHYTNIPRGMYYTDDRDILTETSSFIFECLFHKYLIDKGYSKEEANINLKIRLNSTLYLSEDVSGICGAILYIRNNPESTRDVEPYEREDTFEYKDIVEVIDYFVAGVFSLLAYKNYLDEKINIDNIKDFNNALDVNNNLESLIFLALDNLKIDDIDRACEDITSFINTLGVVKKIK